MGDFFNHGLYDTHIQLKKTPFLEWESPNQLDKLIAEDVMNSSGCKLSYLYPITRVRSIERLLRTTAHSAFPVVTPINSIPILPKNINSEHIPQLYARASILGNPEPKSPTRIRNPDPREFGNSRRGLAPSLDDDDDDRMFSKSYTLPQHRHRHRHRHQQG